MGDEIVLGTWYRMGAMALDLNVGFAMKRFSTTGDSDGHSLVDATMTSLSLTPSERLSP